MPELTGPSHIDLTVTDVDRSAPRIGRVGCFQLELFTFNPRGEDLGQLLATDPHRPTDSEDP